MQVKRAEITMEKQLKSKAEQIENLTEQNKQREDRLNTMLHETESRHCEAYFQFITLDISNIPLSIY